MKAIPIYKKELEKVFRYDADSNILERKLRDGKWREVNIENETDSSGYVQTRFRSRMILIHRIIYTMVKGDIPENMDIVHIDSDRTNNNINNLYLLWSRHNKAKNSGLLNPSFSKCNNSYRVQARAWLEKKQHSFHFGCFKVESEAQKLCDAYNDQFAQGKPQYSARESTVEHWLECMQTFKDLYFK